MTTYPHSNKMMKNKTEVLPFLEQRAGTNVELRETLPQKLRPPPQNLWLQNRRSPMGYRENQFGYQESNKIAEGFKFLHCRRCMFVPPLIDEEGENL